MNLKHFSVLTVIALCVLGGVGVVRAQSSNAEVSDKPVFSLYPSKVEVEINPGETIFKTVRVVNTLGYDANFELSVEDIGPSKNLKEPAILYGDETGPFTVRGLVTLPYRSIVIRNGETRSVQIKITGPDKLDVAGRYGVLLFSVSGEGGDGAQTKVISRLGSTLLVRSTGEAVELGKTVSFGVIGGSIKFYDQSQPTMAQVTFSNEGNVYLNTYGVIVVKNIFGKEVAVRELDPWYVLPGATRLREVSFGNDLGAGLYKLEARVNRGYNDEIDYLSARLVVLPNPLVSVVGLAVLIGLVVWFVSKKRRYNKNA